MTKLLPVAAILAMTAFAAPANAQDFTYSDFSDTSALDLNGNAATAVRNGSTVLRVTPATGNQSGSVFSLSPITLSDAYSFSTSFTFNFNSQGGIEGADGLVFAVQTNSSSFGGAGGGIGYAGLPFSLGVEFDSYNNGAGDGFSNNHVGIDLNGNTNSVALIASPFILDSDTNLTAWIDYNSTTQLLEVFLGTDPSLRPAAALLSYNVDLAAILSGGASGDAAYVGFTSGTGAGWANHDILSWSFNDSYDPISGVPEPSTWAMMLIGFGAVGYSMRRRRRPQQALQRA